MAGARARPVRLMRRARAAVPFTRSGLPEDDAAFESRLVWILGSPRTGSSWLLRLLIHPLTVSRAPSGVSAPPSLGRHERPNVVPVNESHVSRHMTPLTSEPPYRIGGGEEDDDSPVRSGLEGHVSYLFADQYSDVWRPKARDLILARMRAQAESGARELGLHDPFVVIKEPQSQGADVFMSVVPRSRLLFLVRDGREVVRSMLALYGPGGRLKGTTLAPEQERDSRRAFVERQSRRWVRRMASVQAAYDERSAAGRVLVRYEDLTKDTPAELRRLTDWMGLGRTDDQLRAAMEAESANRGPSESGRRSGTRDASVWGLTPEEREVADEMMGPTLSMLGYPV
jgi:hypothetical protein